MSKTLTSQQIQAAVSVIYKARTDSQVKLRFGSRHRAGIIEKMGAQDDSFKDDYRYRWLKETRNRLVQELANAAKEFQTINKHDIISVNDMIDVAESLLSVLKSNQ